MIHSFPSCRHGSDFITPEQLESGGVTHEHTRKWRLLQELQVGGVAARGCGLVWCGWWWGAIRCDEEVRSGGAARRGVTGVRGPEKV